MIQPLFSLSPLMLEMLSDLQNPNGQLLFAVCAAKSVHRKSGFGETIHVVEKKSVCRDAWLW
jgi:hypothetical protein